MIDITYILNLDIVKYKYYETKAKIEKLNISNIKRISAIHGIKVLSYGENIENSKSFYQKFYWLSQMFNELIKNNIIKNKFNILFTPGQIGYFFSFKKFINICLSKNYKHILFLEDDVTPVNNIKIKLEQHINKLPNNWDISILSVNPKYFKKYKGEYIKLNDICKLSGALKQNDMYGIGGFIGSFAMLINKNCLYKLKKLFKYMFAPVDIMLGIFSKENKLNIYSTCENLFIVDLSQSTTNKI